MHCSCKGWNLEIVHSPTSPTSPAPKRIKSQGCSQPAQACELPLHISIILTSSHNCPYCIAYMQSRAFLRISLQITAPYFQGCFYLQGVERRCRRDAERQAARNRDLHDCCWWASHAKACSMQACSQPAAERRCLWPMPTLIYSWEVEQHSQGWAQLLPGVEVRVLLYRWAAGMGVAGAKFAANFQYKKPLLIMIVASLRSSRGIERCLVFWDISPSGNF